MKWKPVGWTRLSKEEIKAFKALYRHREMDRHRIIAMWRNGKGTWMGVGFAPHPVFTSHRFGTYGVFKIENGRYSFIIAMGKRNQAMNRACKEMTRHSNQML